MWCRLSAPQNGGKKSQTKSDNRMAWCNVFAPCHFSMGANTLHLKGDEALTAPVQTARFVCKAERVRELTDTLTHMTRQSPFHVVKVIELTEAQYQHYAAHLGEEAPFITANRALMGTDEHGVTRCLLITVRSRRDGILIDAQGYDYARYSAYIRDKLRLSLRDIPMEHYNLKLRERQKGRDR